MKKLIKFLLLVSGFLTSGIIRAQTIDTPDEIKKFVESGSKLIAYQVANLNGDTRKDAVIVSEKPATDLNRGMDRTLSILLRNHSGKLKSVVRNEHIIACSKCSDFAEDPFDARRLSVKNKKLRIVQYYDIGFHPSMSFYHFKYQEKSREFRTTLAKHVRYEQLDTGQFKRTITQHISDYGTTLSVFNPRWQPPKQ